MGLVAGPDRGSDSNRRGNEEEWDRQVEEECTYTASKRGRPELAPRSECFRSVSGRTKSRQGRTEFPRRLGLAQVFRELGAQSLSTSRWSGRPSFEFLQVVLVHDSAPPP